METEKKKKAQLHSFLRLVYTGTMTRIYPSIDIPFQNKGKFIPEKCPHGDNQEVSQSLGMCSFQFFLSGARYLQNAVDMMKVWVLKFPGISELPRWQLCQPPLVAAPGSCWDEGPALHLGCAGTDPALTLAAAFLPGR